MATRYEMYQRLEVKQPGEDLNRGFLAEVCDPLWFLGRQWQMGEHQGEDASSPVSVTYRASHQPVDPLEGNPEQDPLLIPPEALIESEPDDWWTPGRRLRIGKAASVSLPPVASADPTLLLADLPTPYERFNGKGYDGRRLYARRVELGLDAAHFSEVPATVPVDLWDPAELCYSARLTCAGRELSVPRHAGGHLDWYSVESEKPLPLPEEPLDAVTVFPGRMRYPGAPHPRWWQIEEARVDIGGFPPDRSHFATMLLIDLVVSHSDDWFLYPIVTRAGHAVTLHEVVVKDSFGEEWTVTPPVDWSLFRVAGLAETSLLVFPTVTTPLEGPKLEDVVLGVDEDANLLWAVEQRVHGRDLPTPPRDAFERREPGDPVLSTERKRYEYQPSTPVYPHWHPYTVTEVEGRRRFVQGRLADLAAQPPVLMPEPQARVLSDPLAQPSEPAHQIEPSSVPTQGLRLERRALLARGTDGRPVLWTQRRRLPLLSPPASHLRFDVMQEALTAVS
ncbi:hypothetical protein MFUL124B02_30895 [Myxococcus fulvus 124B02]|nr:hypothetical protein MFUL124B02_30895 [Myxococcus fulvus 124B02]